MNVFELFAKLSLDDSEYKSKLSSATQGIATFAKAGVAAAGAMAAGTAAVTGALVKQTAEVAAYGDNIDKMSQKLGISATAYQEWDAIMQHCGASVDSLKAPMKTLATQAQANASEFQKLGISQQEVATLSQEDLFAKVITGLQGMEEGTERTALASKLLGKGAVEMGALLNTSAEDTEAMRQAVHDLGGVMSDEAVKNAAAFEDQLQDLKTSFSGLKRGMLSELMPSLTTVMKGLTDLFSGVSSGDTDAALQTISKGIDDFISKMTEIGPKAMAVGSTIMSALSSAIVQNVPKLAAAGTDMVVGLSTSIVNALPTIANSAVEVITTFSNGIANALPELVPAAVNAITALADGLISSLPKMVEAAGNLMLGFAQGISNALPNIIQAVPALIGKLAGEIVQSLPTILSTGAQLIMTLGQGIISAIPSLLMIVPQLISGLINAFTEFDWSTFGASVMEHLSSGLSAAGEMLHTAFVTIARTAVYAFRSIDWAGLGRSVINFLANGARALASAIPSVLRSIGSAAMSAFRSIPWSSVGAAAINFIRSGITSLAGLVASGLKSVGTRAMSAFKSINWGSVGKAVVQGIARGITGGAKLVVDAAKNAAKAAFEGAANFLGIHSPSTLFRDKIGKLMAVGMGIGFEDNMPLRQIQGAIDKTVNSLSAQAVLGADMISDMFDTSFTDGAFDALSVNVEESETEEQPNYGEITINVYPSVGMDEKALANMVSDRLTEMYRRRRMSYA